MNKKEELSKKLYSFIYEIDEHKKTLNEGNKQYLENLKNFAETLISRLHNDTLPSSTGGGLGFGRAISEYDDLANIDSLYDMAYEVDLFYSEECQEW